MHADGSLSSHAGLEPSPWIVRWSHLVRIGGSVLDVACGSGRHMRWFASRGHPVSGVDRSPEALGDAAFHGQAVLADIEGGPWPFMDGAAPRRFAAVVVTNYLWRPLLPTLVDSLAEGGALLYETFAVGNETVGRPSRADFLLRPGELLEVCRDLTVVAYECGFLSQPERFVQRVAALRLAKADNEPLRHAL